MNKRNRPTEAFEFGQNWQKFLAKCYSPERLEISKRCLSTFFSPASVENKSFVDVGCGSGLSSLAAHDLGASRLLSFDVDSDSVSATMSLREMRGAPENWSVQHGSALDERYIESLGKWDIVYSWGVLHHTGRMWDAIRMASQLLQPNGLFFIAIYTTTPLTDYWIRVKKRYNRSGWLGKRLMEARYLWRVLVRPNLIFPWRIIGTVRGYKKSRGMDYMTDVRDWLGGWPYEDARVEEILGFCIRELGLRPAKLKTGEGCTEYLFVGPEHQGSDFPLMGPSSLTTPSMSKDK
jgi:2-polyprenyl-3-methyl-5-hydroxy-6-metoxy-1,4-benzoquinol methylase